MEEYKNCPYCGEEIKKNTSKCRFCGEGLNEDKNKTNDLYEDEINLVYHKFKRLIILVITSFIIGIIFSLIYNPTNDKKINSSNISKKNKGTKDNNINKNIKRDFDSKYCTGENGNKYKRPVNAYCDDGKTPQGWTCKENYSATLGKGSVGWYCKCNSKKLHCNKYKLEYGTASILKIDIEASKSLLEIYKSTNSIKEYKKTKKKLNEKISKRNKYLSENCKCKK